jgi:hypothetical protein
MAYRLNTPSAVIDDFQAPGVAIDVATITETKTVKYFKIHVVSLEMFNSVTLAVTLFAENGAGVGARTIKVEGDEYMAWQNDDQYLVDLVAQKLGFTLSQ